MHKWKLLAGDCIPLMAEVIEPQSIDFSVFSPPFPSLYAYTSDPADIGNTDTMGPEAKVHLSFFYRALARVMKPGRVVCVHVCQIPRMKRTGEVGLCDFRGINIRIGERAGLIYEYDWCIRKNPQAQAIRSRSRELQFAGLESDRAKQRGAIADYVIKFRAPGENAVPICDYEPVKIDEDDESEAEPTGRRLIYGALQVSRNQWIDWAEAAWMDIRETHTLNVKDGKGEDDTKHICPLQLDVIDRLVRLYSNPDELVFSPFAGICSEGHVSLKLGRKFLGCELKEEYLKAGAKNLRKVEKQLKSDTQNSLFGETEVADEASI